MLVFRCSRCSKVNISIEGRNCQHCGNEETLVPSVPENQAEVRSTSTNGNDFRCIQNKSAGTDFSVLSQAPDKCNVAKLHENDKKEKNAKILDAKSFHTSSSPGEPMRPIGQNSILKEMLVLPGPTPCNNSANYSTSSYKSGVSVPTKRLKRISGQRSSYRSENNLKEEKAFKCNKNVKSVRKLNRRSSKPYSPKKSVLNSFDQDSFNVNQLKDNQRKGNSAKLLSKKGNSTTNNFQDDLKITKEPSEEVFHKECIKNDLSEKLPIKRIKTPILKKLFLCNKCEKTFFDESKFKVHCVNHFKEKRFKCDRCDKEYFSEIHLKRHYESHIDKGPYKCDFCDLVFIRNCHLSRHRKKHILDSTVNSNGDQKKIYKSSPQREQEANDDDDPQKHFETSAEEKNFQSIAQDDDDPRKHFQTSAGEKIFQHREQEISDDDDPQKHFQTSAGEKTFQQREQEISDDDDPQKQTSAEEKIFLCPECGVKFICESIFNAHSLRHSAQKPFKCNECNKEFRYESELNKHYRVHSLERPFICKICGFSFTQVNNLYKHLKTHA